MRPAQGVTEREGDKEGSRRIDLGAHFPEQAYCNGRDTPVFQDRSDQSDGLIAEGSDRDQENPVRPILD